LVGVDFERAFFSHVANHFSEDEIIGCLSHFKQALCRKMIKLGIHEDAVKFAMCKGVMVLITVIPKDELNPMGVNFVAATILDFCAKELYKGKGSKEYKESEERCGLFWDDYCFLWVIIIGYSISNAIVLLNSFFAIRFWLELDLVRFWWQDEVTSPDQQWINGIFPASHPNLVSFAHALHQEADRVVQHMDDVAKGREVPPDYNEPVFPQIPPELYADKMKATARKGTRKGRSKRGCD